jgi:hypothetical protein
LCVCILMNVDKILTSCLNLKFLWFGMADHQSATVLSGNKKQFGPHPDQGNEPVKTTYLLLKTTLTCLFHGKLNPLILS